MKRGVDGVGEAQLLERAERGIGGAGNIVEACAGGVRDFVELVAGGVGVAHLPATRIAQLGQVAHENELIADSIRRSGNRAVGGQNPADSIIRWVKWYGMCLGFR